MTRKTRRRRDWNLLSSCFEKGNISAEKKKKVGPRERDVIARNHGPQGVFLDSGPCARRRVQREGNPAGLSANALAIWPLLGLDGVGGRVTLRKVPRDRDSEHNSLNRKGMSSAL